MTDPDRTDRAADDLVARLLEHTGQPCITGEEGPIADAVQRRYDDRGDAVQRVANSVVVGRATGARPLVLLVGHLDVVPPTPEDRQPRDEQRDGQRVVVARGASDMKGGNVVAMKLFEERAADAAYELALVLYGGEEGPAEGNELASVIDAVPWLTEADLAVILEPTDLEVQAGCLGGLHAVLTFQGRAAHSARPWHGDNALTKAGAFLAELHELEPTPVEVDGIVYRGVWSATQAWTENARNVIPSRFTVNLNYRFVPDRTLDDAERELRELVDGRAGIEIVDRAPPAPPRLDAPVLRTFAQAVGGTVTAKQAWTDVARFAAVGVPAVNFGPGLTSQAHQAGEHVPVANLVDAHARLRRFLATGPT